jgi:acyl carrier protein phosphodiesterase
MAGSASLVERTAPASRAIGTVVRVRRTFGSETAVIIGKLPDGRAEIVRPTGQIAATVMSKVKENLFEPSAEVRSTPGRLLTFLHSNATEKFRAEPVALAVRQRLDVITQNREQAIGLLLDRGPLSLGLTDCLALPIESWRVRYEFLVAGTEGQMASLLAYAVFSDSTAPIEVRALVALRFGSVAVQRYLADTAATPESLSGDLAQDVRDLREELYQLESGVLAGPAVKQLLDLISADQERQASETLLSDRSVWQLLLDLDVAGNPSSGPLGEEFAGLSAIKRSSDALFEWRWDEARSMARDGLRHARREDVRDELLNIMACALWLQGEPEPALAALDNALEGAYTDALLINASVIASELEHASAMDRLVRLAREAPSAHQRAVAAERALILWDKQDDRIWEDEDDDEGLPIEIRDALRTLISESLPEDRYLRLLRVLANRDDAWLAARNDRDFGVNANPESVNSPAVRVLRARAVGLEKYLEVLTAELGRPNAPAWIAHDRDGVVEAAIEVLIERIDELPAAFFGLTVLDANLPLTASQSVPLKSLVVTSIASHLASEEGEPNLRFIDLVVQASRALSDLDEHDRMRMSGLVDMGADSLARAYFLSRANQMREARTAFRMLELRVAGLPRFQINWQAVREASAPISAFCTNTYNILNRIRPHVSDNDLRDAVTALMSQASDLGNEIKRVTR